MKLSQIVCHTGLLAALVMPAFTVHAMEQLDDQQMAASTGQDGITIAVQLPNSTFAYSQINLVNIEDRSVVNSPRASLVIAPTDNSSTQGVQFFSSATLTTPTTQPFVVKFDADGNAGAPVLNVNFALPTDLQRIRISPFSAYLADGSGNIFTNRRINGSGSNVLRAGAIEILRVGGDGIDVRLRAGDPLALNIQLGGEPQGHMLRFTGGSILQLSSNAPIELMSLNSGGVQNSLRFNLDISATNQTDGFSLIGFYADIDAAGLTFGKNGWTDRLDIRVNNIVAGDIPATSTAFNGLANGSMGSIGIDGLRVENLRVNVSGL